MKKFEQPKMEVLQCDLADIIATSGEVEQINPAGEDQLPMV